jgi:hypothetical protein
MKTEISPGNPAVTFPAIATDVGGLVVIIYYYESDGHYRIVDISDGFTIESEDISKYRLLPAGTVLTLTQTRDEE